MADPQTQRDPLGIEVGDLTVAYRNGHRALAQASFTVPQGSVTALVGVNGAGKSTLFKALMDLLPHATGQVRILGLTVAPGPVAQPGRLCPTGGGGRLDLPRAGARRGDDGSATAIWASCAAPAPPTDRRSTDALARVGLTDYATRQIGELSGGQKKRVFLARALAQEARVILLDEPFTGVDVQTEQTIITLLRQMRDEGRVMLVSTHDLGSVPEYCDRVVLVKGTVLAFGPTETTFTPAPNLRQAFGGTLRHFMLGGTDLHADADARNVDSSPTTNAR